jgi:hypothetical protein
MFNWEYLVGRDSNPRPTDYESLASNAPTCGDTPALHQIPQLISAFRFVSVRGGRLELTRYRRKSAQRAGMTPG